MHGLESFKMITLILLQCNIRTHHCHKLQRLMNFLYLQNIWHLILEIMWGFMLQLHKSKLILFLYVFHPELL